MTQAASLGTEEDFTPAPEGEEQPTPQDNDDESQYIRIPRSELYPVLGKLVDEDPEFGQAARTVLGSRQRREYEAKISSLERERDQLVYQRRQQTYAEVEKDPEALAQKLATDADFRKGYTQYKDAKPPVDPSEADIAYRNAVEDELDRLNMVGLGERAQAVVAAIQGGYFNKDSSGRQLSAPQQLLALRATVDAELAKARQPKDEPPPEPVQANPRLRNSADTSRPGAKGGGKFDLNTQIGLARAVGAGQITEEDYRKRRQQLES